MVNYIRLAWKLTCMLRTYRTCNPMVGFLKYEFNNMLLDDVTFFRVTTRVTWTQLYISQYNIYIDNPLWLLCVIQTDTYLQLTFKMKNLKIITSNWPKCYRNYKMSKILMEHPNNDTCCTKNDTCIKIFMVLILKEKKGFCLKIVLKNMWQPGVMLRWNENPNISQVAVTFWRDS